jgi:hypothetical protein
MRRRAAAKCGGVAKRGTDSLRLYTEAAPSWRQLPRDPYRPAARPAPTRRAPARRLTPSDLRDAVPGPQRSCSWTRKRRAPPGAVSWVQGGDKSRSQHIFIETNENRAFCTEVYSRYIPGICKDLEYVRHMPDICLTYDTKRIPDVCTRGAESNVQWTATCGACVTCAALAASFHHWNHHPHLYA